MTYASRVGGFYKKIINTLPNVGKSSRFASFHSISILHPKEYRRKTEGTPHLYNIKELGLLVTKIIGNLQNEFAAQMIS